MEDLKLTIGLWCCLICACIFYAHDKNNDAMAFICVGVAMFASSFIKPKRKQK